MKKNTDPEVDAKGVELPMENLRTYLKSDLTFGHDILENMLEDGVVTADMLRDSGIIKPDADVTDTQVEQWLTGTVYCLKAILCHPPVLEQVVLFLHGLANNADVVAQRDR